MSYKATPQALDAMLAMLKSDLDGGTVYVFAGPVPAEAGAALDMGQHTQVARFTLNGDGATGLTFDAPSDGALPKPGAAVWEGLVAFEGAQAGQSSLAPTFFRFGKTGDNCRASTTAARLQGTAGGPSSSANMKLTSTTATANGTNRIGAAIFNVRLTSTP